MLLWLNCKLKCTNVSHFFIVKNKFFTRSYRVLLVISIHISIHNLFLVLFLLLTWHDVLHLCHHFSEVNLVINIMTFTMKLLVSATPHLIVWGHTLVTQKHIHTYIYIYIYKMIYNWNYLMVTFHFVVLVEWIVD